jgi:hypothetical protein
MSVKRSPAARVIEFFTAAPIGEAELVYGLVREVVRKRKAVTDTVTAPVVKKRRTRKVNTKAPDATTASAQPVA